MNMDKKIFNRVEKKYLLDMPTKKKVLNVLEKNMREDEYFKSEIFNIYFDTDNFDLIVKSIENPDFKQKFRARGYSGFDKVFLEIKTKDKVNNTKVSHKRRILLTHRRYKKFVKGEKTAEELVGGQIAREVDYLVSYFNLKPQILVYYDRKSYTGENGLRVTFDEHLSYRDKNLDFKRTVRDKHYFDDKRNIIMEVKASSAMPLWLVRLLSENKIYPERFSKVGKIYEKIRKEQNV